MDRCPTLISIINVPPFSIPCVTGPDESQVRRGLLHLPADRLVRRREAPRADLEARRHDQLQLQGYEREFEV